MDRYEGLVGVDPEVFDRVWKVVLEIGQAERHFNLLQNAYRALASTWMLGTFAGIGFLLTNKLVGTIDRYLLSSGVALAGACGVSLLWVLDLLVYHRLLDSFFREGLSLESTYVWLPPVRQNMERVHSGRGVLPKVVLFYCTSAGVLCLIAIAFFCSWLAQFGVWPTLLTALASLLALAFSEYGMAKTTISTPRVVIALTDGQTGTA